MLYIQDDKFLAVAAIIQNIMNGSCRLFFGFLFDRLGFKVFTQHFVWSTMSFSIVSNDIFRIHTSFKVLLVPVSPSFLWTSYYLMGTMLEQRHSSFLCHLPCMLLYQVKCKANKTISVNARFSIFQGFVSLFPPQIMQVFGPQHTATINGLMKSTAVRILYMCYNEINQTFFA